MLPTSKDFVNGEIINKMSQIYTFIIYYAIVSLGKILILTFSHAKICCIAYFFC